MQKLFTIPFLALLFFIGPLLVSAQETNLAQERGRGQEKAQEKKVFFRTNFLSKKQVPEAKIERVGFGTSTLKGEKKEQIEEKRAEIQQKQEDRKQQHAEKRMERIRAYFERVTKRLGAALERFTILGDRLNSRFEKLEGRGVNTDNSRAHLEVAREKITHAESILLNSKNEMEGLLSGELTKETFSNVKKLIKDVITGIKDTHRSLINAIKEVKAAAQLRTNETENVQVEQ